MIKFYEVDKKYIDYLKKTDRKVPNISYNKHDKFMCGVVLNIEGRKYYAPVSSFAKRQRTNVLIKNNAGKVTSSIRFSFMFPVPDDKITEKDFSQESDITYRRLMMEEYKYCNQHEDEILDKAQYIYKSVTQDKNPLMIKNCCNFTKLEAAYDRYVCINHAQAQKQEIEPFSFSKDKTTWQF